MKHRVLIVLTLAALLAGLVGAAPVAAAGPGGPSHMPPNEGAIMKALRARGVIPAGASPEQAQAIYQQYIRQKLAQPEDRPNPLGAKQLARGEAKAKPQNTHGRVMQPNNQRFDNVLTLLVEFAGDEGGMVGPLHNQIAQPDPALDNTSYWISDFNPQHYKDMLFSTQTGARSMANYYLEQSGGTYTVDGQVYGWVKVPHSEWYYGADSATGTDDLNGPVWRIVADAVAAAGNSIPWAQFDTEDPYDLDGDGNYAEPDGFVDHIQLVHAGADQSAGGGAQGDSAIWAHSWYANYPDGIPTADPNVKVGAYTINPEDGTIGVFCHEFAHNLGLPDLYDTIYSGEASTGFWTLMASGSWSGCPGEALGTCPSPMGAWEKYAMGWLDPVVVSPGEAKSVTLKNATSAGPSQKAVRVNLPNYSYSFKVNTPHSGTHEWYSGMGDMLNNTLTRPFTLPAGSPILKFWTWYDIEQDWDYGYVEVSADGGATWTSVAGNITTTTNPNGNNAGNGITGSSDWTEAVFDLSAWAGKTVLLRFRYATDEAVSQLGWTIDDITLNDALIDDVEGDTSAWTAVGWKVFGGQEVLSAAHYYLAEWRTPTGFDVSMNSWYNFVHDNVAEFYQASPGLLVWYRNTRFTDNWVGVHPWQGRLLLVDAHPQLVLANDLTKLAQKLFKTKLGLPFRTRIQLADAAFGLTTTPNQPLTSWFGVPTNSALPQLAGVPTFDDSVTYVDRTWEPWFYSSDYSAYIRNSIDSVLTPHYGLKITVTGGNSQAGKINVDFGGFHMPQ